MFGLIPATHELFLSTASRPWCVLPTWLLLGKGEKWISEIRPGRGDSAGRSCCLGHRRGRGGRCDWRAAVLWHGESGTHRAVRQSSDRSAEGGCLAQRVRN